MLQKFLPVMFLASSFVVSCGTSDNKAEPSADNINVTTRYTTDGTLIEIPEEMKLKGAGEDCTFLLPQSFSYEGFAAGGGIKVSNRESVDEPFVVAQPIETRLIDAEDSLLGSYSFDLQTALVQRKVILKFNATQLDISLHCDYSGRASGEAARTSRVTALPKEATDTLK